MRQAIAHLKQADPVMRGIIERLGPYRMRYLAADYDTLAKSIVYQQVSGKAARAMYNRLVEACGGGKLAAEAVLRLGEEQFRAAGISRQKRRYLVALAEATVAGRVDFAALHHLPDDEVIRVLTALPGIGVWTVQMFLMFALRRLDVLPSADIGIQRAVAKAYGLPAPPKPKEVEALGQPWRPYCTVASWYLWRSLEDDPGM